MPVSPSQDRVLGPGVREDLLQSHLGLGHPVQVEMALQVSVLHRTGQRSLRSRDQFIDHRDGTQGGHPVTQMHASNIAAQRRQWSQRHER